VDDSYSPSNLAKYVESNAFEKLMFRAASKYHFKYLSHKAKNRGVAVLFMMIAIGFCPTLKIEEIYNRYIIKRLKGLGNRN
jgi:hypothetical protein